MANLKSDVCNIINALKNKIVEFGTPEGRKKLEEFIEPDYQGRCDNLFVRESPLSVTLLLVYLLRHNPLSTQVSIDAFFDDISRTPVSKSAISQRRTRLKPEIFDYFDRELLRQSYQILEGSLRLWHGWHILACDGSDFALPDTDAVAEYFERYRYRNGHGNRGKTFPMGKAVMISDILNGFTLCSRLLPYKTNEGLTFSGMLPELLHTAPLDLMMSILLFDRGFFSLKLMYDMIRAGLKFVVRLNNVVNIVRDFVASGRTEADVEWMPTPDTSLGSDPNWKKEGRKPLKLRLVRVHLSSGETEVLATNLTSDEVGASAMKKLYFLRWPIEVEFLHYKHVYQIEAFSGARPVCVIQDFRAVILCHNMACLVTDSVKDDIEADCRNKKYSYKTNTAVFVGVFFMVFVRMMMLDRTNEYVNYLERTARKILIPIHEDRSYPRVRKKHKKTTRNLTFTNRKRVV